MPTSQQDRATAVYNAILQQNPKMADASGPERQRVHDGLQAIFGADLAYLLGAVTVLPGSMQAQPGASVQVAFPAGSGATTSPATIAGTGRIS